MAKTKNKEKRVCCICGKEIDGWGNDPWGALDEKGNQVQFKEDDVCCDECNLQYVIPGRYYTLKKNMGE